MPDFGIGETAALLGGSGGLAGLGELFGFGGAEAAGAGAGAAEGAGGGFLSGLGDLFGFGGAAEGAAGAGAGVLGDAAGTGAGVGAGADLSSILGFTPSSEAMGSFASAAPSATGSGVASTAGLSPFVGGGDAASLIGGATSIPGGTSAAGATSGLGGSGGLFGGLDLSSAAKWLGPAAGAAGLGLASMNKGPTEQAQKMALQQSQEAKAMAQPYLDQGKTYQGYLQSGTVTAPMQAQLDQRTNDAVTAMKSKAAANGMDPNGSIVQEQERQIRAQADQAKVQMEMALAQQGNQMTDEGMRMLGLSGTDLALYSKIASDNQAAWDKAMASFVSSFASLGGGSKGTSNSLVKIG